MRCAGVRLIIGLLLGTATTVALSLSLAAWMPMEMYPRQASHTFIADGRPWMAVERRRLGMWNVWWSEISADYMLLPLKPGEQRDPTLPTTAEGWLQYARESRKTARPRFPLTYPEHPPSWGSFDGGRSVPRTVASGTDHGFGWPRPALWYRVDGEERDLVASATEIRGGLLLTPRAGLEIRAYTFRALPYWVHWPGLLLNTALFVAIWCVVLLAPRAVRRGLRRRRGRCPDCGYDLRGDLAPGCPECGWNRDGGVAVGMA